MSKNGSDREFILKLHMKFFSEGLEKALGVKFTNVELEKFWKNRKVDFFGITQCNKQIFGEVQFGVTDMVHYQQLEHIVNNIDVGNNILLFWAAESFNPGIINRVQECINKSKKNIEFIGLKLNSELMQYLEALNSMHTFRIMENLRLLNTIEEPFKLYAKYYRLNNENADSDEKLLTSEIDVDTNEGVMTYLLNEARRQIFYFPSIHRDKKFNGNYFSLGGGIADVSYNIGLNRKNLLYVELRFSGNAKSIYELIINDKDIIDDKLDYLVEYDSSFFKLGSYIYCRKNNREQVLKQIIRILDKYIKVFTPYIINIEAVSS